MYATRIEMKRDGSAKPFLFLPRIQWKEFDSTATAMPSYRIPVINGGDFQKWYEFIAEQEFARLNLLDFRSWLLLSMFLLLLSSSSSQMYLVSLRLLHQNAVKLGTKLRMAWNLTSNYLEYNALSRMYMVSIRILGIAENIFEIMEMKSKMEIFDCKNGWGGGGAAQTLTHMVWNWIMITA